MTDPVARLRWQCRRGTRELDELLTGYLERHYPIAPASQKSAFRALLALPDALLAGYLLQREQPDSAAIADVVKAIQCQHPA